MTRGALTTFSIANDVAKYFAIIPAMFLAFYPQLACSTSCIWQVRKRDPVGHHLQRADHHRTDPLALKGVAYRAVGAARCCAATWLIYGLGGIIIPFIGIKAIDSWSRL